MFKTELRTRLSKMEDKENKVPSTAVKSFIAFFASSFFRHYTSYQLAFNEFQNVDVEVIDMPIQTPQAAAQLA